MDILLVVVTILVFIYVSRRAFAKINNSQCTVSELYLNGELYRVVEGKVLRQDGSPITSHQSYFDELTSNLADLSQENKIFKNEYEYVAISNFVSAHKASAFQKALHYEFTQYNEHLKYGGCYTKRENKCETIHLIGDVEAILHHCKDHTDKEEILRVAKKQTSKTVRAVASEDCTHMQKNVLTRGVKGKMTFIGLVVISQ